MNNLLKHNAKYYSLIGFYIFNNSKEYFFDVDSVLIPDYKIKAIHPLLSTVALRGYGYFSNFAELKHSDLTHVENAFISELGLNHSSVYIYHTRCCSFIFQINQETLSFSTKYYTDPKILIMDYVNNGNSIHLLKSSFRMVQELTNQIIEKPTRNEINKIDKDNINLFFFESIKNNIECNNKPKEQYIPEQKSFELLQNYSNELIELNKKIIEKAQNYGGFVKFVFNNKEYDIPKIPFLIWSNLVGVKYFTGNSKFTFDNYVWNTVCSDQGIKTYDDSLIHSDWWIGAGFPIEVYQDEMNYYFEFNKALNSFSYEYIKNFVYGSAITLAGHDLPTIKGKVVLRPKTINDFNEDDIIVLPNASVEFDSFIKKCCKNGKGAVIVEVNNKVSHLLIVSREMNNKGKSYRLLSMPNAYETLKNGNFYTVDTQNNLIKHCYD